MGRFPRFLRAAVWIASVTLLFPFAHAQKTREPLTEGEVMRLLQGGVAPQRVEKLAREAGIAFEMNVAVERDLRSAGATDQLLQTLRELAPGKGQAKPKNGATGILLITVDAACKLAVDGEHAGELAAGASKRLTLPFGEHQIRAVSMDEPKASVEWTGKVENPDQSLVRLALAEKVAAIKAKETHEKRMSEEATRQAEIRKNTFPVVHFRQFGEGLGYLHITSDGLTYQSDNDEGVSFSKYEVVYIDHPQSDEFFLRFHLRDKNWSFAEVPEAEVQNQKYKSNYPAAALRNKVMEMWGFVSADNGKRLVPPNR